MNKAPGNINWPSVPKTNVSEGKEDGSPHTEKIRERLLACLRDPQVRARVTEDWNLVFNELGLSKDDASQMVEHVTTTIEGAESLEEAEEKLKGVFRQTKVGDKDILERIKETYRDRTEKIISQISPYLLDIKGKVFDYGMGSGGIAQKLHVELGLDMEGGDVRDFRSPDTTVPFVLLNSVPTDGRIVNVPDGYYEAAVVTNVLHHEAQNENILNELDRIVVRRLVVIETVPVGDTAEEVALDRERTFAGDAFSNRFFKSADIPVPGTYETPQGWTDRFAAHGWKVVHSEDLGFDQKVVHDAHYLFVLEK